MPAPGVAVRFERERPSPALVSVDGRTYPLRSAQIRARAEGGLASSTLNQVFANPYDEPLEVVYTLPLPADGAVIGYTIRIGERVIRGEVEPREKAEAAYRQALYEGRTAGLLEEDRSDTFQQRLGNLPPRTEVSVEIEVLQLLAFLGGVGEAGPVWEYRFPTVVGPRYQGAPGRVPDAERLDLDRGAGGGIPARLTLDLIVADALSGSDRVVSPSHEIMSTSDGRATTVRLADSVRLDRDLVLQWPASAGEVGVRMVEGRGLPSDTGRYALLTVTPPRVTHAAQHRDLTVLIDASGSMSGMPLELAKRVVSDVLKSLEAGDRFEVIAFASTPWRLMPRLEEATPESVGRCLEAVTALEAGGGTEMVSAIEEALSPLRQDAQHQVVLVTDGQIGFEKELLARVGRSLPAGVRLHTVGIGSAPNRALTRSLARGGRGAEFLAGDEASAVEGARRLCAATVRPVLTDLSLTGPALRACAPARPHDVFEGQALVVAVELGEEGGALEVKGTFAGSREEWSWRMDVPRADGPGAAAGAGGAPAPGMTSLPVGALFGREAIADAEFELAAGGQSDLLDAQIETLGMRHRVVSRRTSLVGISEEPTVDPRAPRRRERLPVELPAGISAEGVGLRRAGKFIELRRTLSAELRPPHGAARGRDDEEIAGGLPKARGTLGGRDDEEALGLPRGPQFLRATVVQLAGPELVMEFESPFDGFHFPTGAVTVLKHPGLVEGRRFARVVIGKSSPSGPHAAKLIIRLALQMEDGAAWLEGSLLVLFWGEDLRLKLVIPPGTDRTSQER
jgi:Ca-activated chloride channel homolog